MNHNTHHVVTNSLTHDPDIQYLPIFAITPKMLSGFYSFYHRKTFGFDKAAKALCAVQHWLYYPIMAVAKVNLYIQSHIFLFGSWCARGHSTRAARRPGSRPVSTRRRCPRRLSANQHGFSSP